MQCLPCVRCNDQCLWSHEAELTSSYSRWWSCSSDFSLYSSSTKSNPFYNRPRNIPSHYDFPIFSITTSRPNLEATSSATVDSRAWDVANHLTSTSQANDLLNNVYNLVRKYKLDSLTERVIWIKENLHYAPPRDHSVRKSASHNDQGVELELVCVDTISPSREVPKYANRTWCRKHHIPPCESKGIGSSHTPPEISHPHNSLSRHSRRGERHDVKT